ncbi:ABC transporter permease [Nanobdella aerobiophila]|uniref:ABC transporter permease n=1 Tax=Nanobdella aerobiophila TaxID=2586965 RepID=A0A915WSM5_9ARCH|nr:FtsX-like permease family protein [Nanobdella aerobiophila]BBL45475.1 ABC transporter permease [Nanobdella aerobiophila]
MKIDDYFLFIYKYLSKKKLRTLLTSIGITIGVATIFVLVSLSQGLQNYISNQLSTLGDKVIFIYPGVSKGFSSSINGFISNTFLENIQRLPGVQIAIPEYLISTEIYYNNNYGVATVYVINTKYINYLKYDGYQIYQGSLINNNDQCQVDIGYNIYKGNNNPNDQINVGDYINIFNQRCEVIGIFQETGGGFNNEIIFPEGYYKKIFGNINYNYLMIIVYNYNLAYIAINDYINSLKGQSYVIITAKSLESEINSIVGGLTIFSLIIASVSLLISAINILNTMYTSVLERYKEIGLLKALGMDNNEVLFLFLLESGIIGLIGGIFGIIFGYIMSNIAGFIFKSMGFTALQPYISIQLIIFSLLFPFFIGILSGTIPAIKASRIDPMIALRYE